MRRRRVLQIASGVDLILITERAPINRLRDLVGLSGRRPDIVMRFGRAPAMPMSVRRPVDAVTI